MMMNYSSVKLGSQCAAARKLKGVSLRKLQELTGYDKSKLSRFENGKFDEGVFIYYYPFWSEWFKLYSLEQRPSDTMKEIDNLENYFAVWPQYCIYNLDKEEEFARRTGKSCLTEYWKLHDHIARFADLIEKDNFTR